MSRVTGPKIFENFRTCHGSPRGFSKVQNQSQNRRKMPQKPIFVRAARTGVFPRRSDSARSRTGNEHFSRPSGILRMSGSPLILATVAGLAQKILFSNLIDLHRLLARSSYRITVEGAFSAISEGLVVPPISNGFSKFFRMSRPSHPIFETQTKFESCSHRSQPGRSDLNTTVPGSPRSIYSPCAR
jgi:hypothetical protein